ncbi:MULTISPECIES: ABC transporter permease [unclassified Lactococcus]|uniref:ABC transporter permease n=1 Tax=unclassified Lactococcus TaxID=2643510 RepID=UPI0011CB0DA4|nr:MULTISPECIES: ABC transporter permease [unclassified Lactococcus]MQW23062.1 ABC transporter permease subunit [Lactococcus sp. dk101]TXK44407.1 ABC transporter permease subunit [Lactococcus sp. dk310]TXK50217.1 ABC transporter permease subunit [Lactococcus sp. dk322]
MRTRALIKRILLQRKGDKRSLALMFIAPLLILTLLYFLLQIPSNLTYRVGVDNQSNSTALVDQLKKSDKLDVISVSDANRQTINDKNLAAAIVITDKKISVTYANTDNSKTQVVSGLLAQTVQKVEGQKSQASVQATIESILTSSEKTVQSVVKSAAEAGVAIDLNQSETPKLPTLSSPTIESHYLYGNSKLNPFNSLAPVLVVVFVFFFVFLISGISLVGERSSGTLTRQLISPVKRQEIVLGYTVAYGILAILQTLLVLFFVRYVLGMEVVGNFVWVIVINLVLAIIALMFSLLLSAVSKNEFQFIQFIPIALVPQVLFSGLINVDTMEQPLQWIAHIMPLYYGIDALTKVVKQGLGFSMIWFDLLILVLIAVILYGLNVVALKSLRRT